MKDGQKASDKPMDFVSTSHEACGLLACLPLLRNGIRLLARKHTPNQKATLDTKKTTYSLTKKEKQEQFKKRKLSSLPKILHTLCFALDKRKKNRSKDKPSMTS
jgi:hypothetical protein